MNLIDLFERLSTENQNINAFSHVTDVTDVTDNEINNLRVTNGNIPFVTDVTDGNIAQGGNTGNIGLLPSCYPYLIDFKGGNRGNRGITEKQIDSVIFGITEPNQPNRKKHIYGVILKMSLTNLFERFAAGAAIEGEFIGSGKGNERFFVADGDDTHKAAFVEYGDRWAHLEEGEFKEAEEVPVTDTRKYCHQCQHHRPIPGKIQIINCVARGLRLLDDIPRHCGSYESKGHLREKQL